VDRGGRHLTAEMRQDPLRGHRQRAVKGAAAGIFVTAAAKPLCDGGHVHLALAAQAEANAVVAQFAQEDSNLDPPMPMA
jgi:CDGSH-type Zn-finger protein